MNTQDKVNRKAVARVNFRCREFPLPWIVLSVVRPLTAVLVEDGAADVEVFHSTFEVLGRSAQVKIFSWGRRWDVGAMVMGDGVLVLGKYTWIVGVNGFGFAEVYRPEASVERLRISPLNGSRAPILIILLELKMLILLYYEIELFEEWHADNHRICGWLHG